METIISVTLHTEIMDNIHVQCKSTHLRVKGKKKSAMMADSISIMKQMGLLEMWMAQRC